MRKLLVVPLRFNACGRHTLWASLAASRHLPRSSVFTTSTRDPPCSTSSRVARLATSRAVIGPGSASASTPTGAATLASPAMSGSDNAAHHVVAFCRTAEDAGRVGQVAKEVAAPEAQPGSPDGPTLVLHLDPAAVPSYAAPTLDAAGCSRRLALPVTEGGTRTMGRVLLAAATLGSTQDLLRTHGSVLGDGVVAVADRQTSGKGRGGNQWTSPPGCLMFSALRRLRVSSPTQAPFINYLVCLAIIRGVHRAIQESGLVPLPDLLRIKWPNDIYSGGLKVAGALIHTTWQGGCFNVITGIGLNVNNRTPTTCLDELLERAAAERAAEGGAMSEPSLSPSVSREAVLTGILAALEEVYDIFEQCGFGPLESEYMANWLHSGQVLDFDDSEPSSTGSSSSSSSTTTITTQGAGAGSTTSSTTITTTSADTGRRGAATRLVIRGLSPSGFLLAEDVEGGASAAAGGAHYELTPDGNSLDMMKGLIRRKVQ